MLVTQATVEFNTTTAWPHFLSHHPVLSWCERAISPLTQRIGFRTDLSLALLLARANLTSVGVERVNRAGLWTVVVCRKPL